MWIKEGAEKPTGQQWDEFYRSCEGAQVELRPEVQERLDEVLEIVGSTAGAKILDLGGGALLGRACKDSLWYALVEISEEAIRIAKSVAPWTMAYRCDVLDYLKKNVLASEDGKPTVFSHEYHVTVAVGLVEYFPEGGMGDLFRLCPSPTLAFTTAVKEAYLKYPLRITVPTREEVAEVAEKYGWRVTRELKRPDHVWARYERK